MTSGLKQYSFLGIFAAVSALGPATAEARQAMPQSADCIECHQELDEERLWRPAVDFPIDVHARSGFGCLSCHGPDPTGASSAIDSSLGFLSKPSRVRVSDMCGRCHSNVQFMRNYNPSMRVDQLAEYASSVHGQRMAENEDPNVATCATCHPAHRILPPTDQRSSVHPLNVSETCGACHADSNHMAGYDVSTDQKDLYEQSIHWQWMVEQEDFSAPTCNDCHGNHGAAPPGVGSVHNVCGQCHSIMYDFFESSLHGDLFAQEGLPGCATCHDNHDIVKTDDDLLVEMNDSVCRQCHTEGDAGWNGFREMAHLIDSLENALEQSNILLEEAEQLGMEVSQAQFDLEDVTNALVKARTAIHAFAVDSVLTEIQLGIASTELGTERGQAALDEHMFRRQGLAVSVALILFLVTGIVLLIRQIERPQPTGFGASYNHQR